LLSTESCDRKKPFICEVKIKIIEIHVLIFSKQVRLGYAPDKDAVQECSSVMKLKKSIEIIYCLNLKAYNSKQRICKNSTTSQLKNIRST